jgi:hypothetical protein
VLESGALLGVNSQGKRDSSHASRLVEIKNDVNMAF